MYRNFIFLIVLCFLGKSLGTCPADGIKEQGVTGADITAAVDRHNYWRTQIASGDVPDQPKSSNMLKMLPEALGTYQEMHCVWCRLLRISGKSWDAKLAKSAQALTDTCVFAHVKTSDSRWFAVGQNLYTSSSTDVSAGANWASAVDSWFNEVKSFTYPNISTGITGHYTQVVWADSWALGCGYTYWYNSAEPSFKYKKLYACNYGPAGNFNNEAPYKAAVGCAALCNPNARMLIWYNMIYLLREFYFE